MLGVLGQALAAIPDAIVLGLAALGFDASAFRVAGAGPGLSDLAILVAYIAGVSQAIGHGVVLFLNRVRPARFVLSLVLMGALYLTSALVTAVSAIALADLALGRSLAFLPTVSVIALGHAPRLLGFLVLAPYFGELFDRLLDVWVLMLVLFGLHHGVGLPVHAAALMALLGWGAMRLLELVFGRPLTLLVNAFKRAAAGGPLTLTAGNVVEALKQQVRESNERRDRGE